MTNKRAAYKRLGDYIEQVNLRNTELRVDYLVGLTINKKFISSVANIIGTDLSNYKLIKKNQFACSLMQVSRDGKIPIARFEGEIGIMSPAYPIFKIIDEKTLMPEYLMMWFERDEFDREAAYYAVGGVRGTLTWEDFCDMKLPLPPISEQHKIVAEYQTIENKIKVNQQICEKLEAAAQAIYKEWFVEFNFPNKEGKPYKDSGGKMVWNDELDKEVPEGWEVKELGEISSLITKGTTPKKMSSIKDDKYKVAYIKGESIGERNKLLIDKLSFIKETTHAQQLQRSKIFKNDLLLSIAGTLGKFCLIKEKYEFNCNQAVAIIRSEISHFLYWTFISGIHKEYFRYNIQQSVQANFSLTTIREFKILIPTNIDLIELFIKNFLGLAFVIETQNQKLTELKSLLLARMVK
ncbi:MAG: restriction endonuclease subunit S [Bacteroidales bacterium]